MKNILRSLLLAALIAGPAHAQQTSPPIGLLPANNLSDLASALAALGNLVGAPLASPTFTGIVTTPQISIGGNISAASWTTNGLGLIGGAATYTDTTATGTVTTEAAFAFPAITLNSTSSATFTNWAGVYFPAALCTGNATCTNRYALYAAGLVKLNAGLSAAGGVIGLNSSSNFATNIGTGTTNAAVTIGGSSNTVNLPGIASSSAAQTGTVCWTTSTGNLTVDTTTTCLLSLEEFKTIEGYLNPFTALWDEVWLKPFWGKYKKGYAATDFRTHSMLGAHQVESVDKRLVGYDPKGKLTGVRYADSVTSLNVAAIQGLLMLVGLLFGWNIWLTFKLKRRGHPGT